MDTTPDRQVTWKLNFFGSKVKEFDFYLREIIRCCDQSMIRFKSAQQGTAQSENRIVFAFSAFSNSIQSLKDNASAFLPSKITWGDIAALRHGNFISLSRNAATHDGHPVITAWADGYYFVPADIHRIDQRGELIRIEAPTEDVGRFCLEFSRDFSELLTNRVRAMGPTSGRFILGIEEIEQGLQSRMVPDFVRQLFHEKRAEIHGAINAAEIDPARDVIALLARIMEFCDQRLDVSPHSS